MRCRVVFVSSALLAWISACADPCLDDGLGQQEGTNCDADESASASESVTATATDTAASETQTASDTMVSESMTSATATVTDSDSVTDTATATATDTATDSETGVETESDTAGPTTYCADADMDGFGDPDQCTDVPDGETPPDGTVPNADDCDDTSAQTFPGAAEDDSATECMKDEDEDGYGDDDPPQGVTPGTDCADDNAEAYPGAAAQEAELCAVDQDGDGYGDSNPPDGVDPGTDCIDDNPYAFPGAAPLDDPTACMEDEDDDDYGDSDPPAGAEAGTDCDDMDTTIPAQMTCMVWCADDDNDQYGDPADCVFEPTAPQGYVGNNSDCDDTNADTFPGAAPNDSATECMRDEDGDDYGDDNPPGGVTPGTDCDDLNANIVDMCTPCMPGEFICNGNDDSAQCNDNGTGYDVVEDCQYGCDDGNGVCWVELMVDADQFVCIDIGQGETYVFNPSVSGGDGNYTYNWDPDAEILGPDNVANAIGAPDDVTTYTLNVTDGEGNFGSDDVTIHVAGVQWNILTDCDFYTFPDPFGDQSPDPNHVFSNGGTVVCNTQNSLPNAFVCPNVYEQARIIGRMTVTDQAGDDDSIGFVWGWQDDHNFYILSWKQADQVTPTFGLWPAGVIIKRIQAPPAATITAADILEPADTANSTLIAGPADVYNQGWVEGIEYQVDVSYGSPTTDITVSNINNPADPMDDVEIYSYTVNDGTFPSGQFGTFDVSQVNACNGPWTSTCL